jgi:hypothetical protein
MSEAGIIDGGGDGATIFGFAIGFFAIRVAAFVAGAAFAAAFFGAALFALAFTGLLGFLDERAFFLTVLLLFAAARFAFAIGRFFPLPFFFAMVALLLGMVRLLVLRVVLNKSAVICA